MEMITQKIEMMQQLLLKYNINLFPQGLQSSQSFLDELLQIIKDDQEFNDNLNLEINSFLAIEPERLKQILNYDAHLKKHEEFGKMKKSISEAEKMVQSMQKEQSLLQAFIFYHLITDHDRIMLLEDGYAKLAENKNCANQEIQNLNQNSIYEMTALRCPPQVALIVAQIIVILLTNTYNEKNIWDQFRRILQRPKGFIDRLAEFQIEKEVSLELLSISINMFQTVNANQCQNCSLLIYTLYQWSKHQLNIADIMFYQQQQFTVLENHHKALKNQERVKEIQQNIIDCEQFIQKHQDQQGQIQNESEQSAQVLQTVKIFFELQKIIRPKQYGIQISQYLTSFLEQQQITNSQMQLVLDDIMTNVFENYIQSNDTQILLSQYPVTLNMFFTQSKDIRVLTQQIIMFLQNPFQFYHNLKQLNGSIKQGSMIEVIQNMIIQIYLNTQSYQHELLENLFSLAYQTNLISSYEIQFPIHQILKIVIDNQAERKVVYGMIKLLKKLSNIPLQDLLQLKYQGMPIIDYLINTYLEENGNMMHFNEGQQIEIKNMILQQNQDIDSSMEIILHNYSVILRNQQYYNQVQKQFQDLKQKIIQNKKQQDSLANQMLDYKSVLSKIQNNLIHMSEIKNKLEDQLKLVKDKDCFLKQIIAQYLKILLEPIHQGIKINELAFFQHQYQFNTIQYFASRITLIQLGLNKFTPDIVRKFLGTQGIQNQLKALTINKLRQDQLDQLEQQLIDFNQIQSLSYFKNKAVQNLIKRPFKIFYLKNFQKIHLELQILRSDLLHKKQVIQNKLNLVIQFILNLESQLILKLQKQIANVQKDLDFKKQIDDLFQDNITQLNEMLSLQEFIREFLTYNTADLSIFLFQQGFNQKYELEDKQKLSLLTQMVYSQDLRSASSFNQVSKFNLLIMYLQQQYQNITTYFSSIYENIWLLKLIKPQITQDALSFSKYVNIEAIKNINFLIGIFVYQLFYNDYGPLVSAICLQPDAVLTNVKQNTQYQIIVLNEILQKKYGSFTLSVVLQLLKQVIAIQQKISHIQDILSEQIRIDSQNQIGFKEFQEEISILFDVQIQEFLK